MDLLDILSNTDALTLAKGLVDCEKSKELALKKIAKEDRMYVIYYLD